MGFLDGEGLAVLWDCIKAMHNEDMQEIENTIGDIGAVLDDINGEEV